MKKNQIVALVLLAVMLCGCAYAYHKREVKKAVAEFDEMSWNFYLVNCQRYISRDNCEALLLGLPVNADG